MTAIPLLVISRLIDVGAQQSLGTFTFPFAIAFELPICYVFVEYSANRISFRLLFAHWEKRQKNLCMCGRVYCMHMSVFPAASLSFTSHSLSFSLSITVKRLSAHPGEIA